MQYRILSEEMQDREVKVLMSMLVPGSVVQRIERLHDVNGIDVYFKRGVSDQELMVSFFPDEVEECQFYIPIENLSLYTLYNLIEGYSTFWSHAPVNPDKESKLADPLLDEVIAFWERQFLEEGDLKDTHMKCGETWDRIVHYSMEANDGLKEDVSRLEELDSTFQRSCRKYFYVQGLTDAYRVLSLVGALKPE